MERLKPMSRAKNKWRVNWRLPSTNEIGLFILGFIFFGIFDYAQNFFQDTGNIDAMTWFGMSAINLFWISIICYHIVLFTAIIRALLKPRTSHRWDFIFGSLAILGVYVIIGGALAGIYFGTVDVIPWFFSLPQVTLYHIGVVLQVLAFIWFVLTD
jgi:hypothetical protein